MSVDVALDLALLRQRPLPRVAPDADKTERGDLVIVAGARGLAGAAVLACDAALRAGAGRVTLITAACHADHLSVHLPEVRVLALATLDDAAGLAASVQALPLKSLDVLLEGPGIRDEAAATAVAGALSERWPKALRVFDAAAMASAAGANTVITPHAGEAAHLLRVRRETVEDDPRTHAIELARTSGSHVLLKGADTWLATVDQGVFIHRGANPGLGVSGSGDVLAGILAGLITRGASIEDASLWAVAIHAEIGAELAQASGPIGFLPRDMPEHLPATIRRLAARG